MCRLKFTSSTAVILAKAYALPISRKVEGSGLILSFPFFYLESQKESTAEMVSGILEQVDHLSIEE